MSKELNDYKMNYPANVYQEEEVPLGKIRVWLSLDVNDDPVSAKREAIWDMLTPYKVESWGTSVYTYLDNDKTSSELKKELISNLQEIDIFNKKNWQDTPNISISLFGEDMIKKISIIPAILHLSKMQMFLIYQKWHKIM